ncbi:FG-GAP-like repeat-containing protein [Terrabacter sp. MAHUQ-38]|uniref:FG-GAP-like repeat-containing protein n=1 Tax=unclassified Terrabacter TaxID=2630222 RepID=UPI00165DD50B|nr:FG-GAP-like repeat-containing protein [Terrabacter sp. MAHUQ-38]MBC9822735.1 VCBS repeat-containing protein [Terrabacter sp. MAHUQ-38]
MVRQQLGARALTVGVAAAALLAPIALALPADAGQTAGSHDPDQLRGRTGRLLVDGHGAAAGATLGAKRALDQSALNHPARRSAAAGRDAAGGLSGLSLTGDAAPKTSQLSAQAAASTCAEGVIEVNPMTDRTVVRATSPQSGTLTLQRLRESGSWRSIGTATGTAITVNDTTVNERVTYQYRLITKVGTDVVFDCTTEHAYGMWTEDGWGDPDAVVAGTTGIFQQNLWAAGSRAVASRWISPAYSTDGRLYAATKVIDSAAGRGVMEVRRASNSALVFSVDLGTAFFPGDPAFSPDGQTLAYTRYDAATGDAIGLGFVDVFGSHTKTTLNTTTRIGEPSWRPDGATLVVSTFGVATPGLALVTRATGAVSPISGTAGGYTPEVAADGSIYFGWSGTAAPLNALKKRVANGTVTAVRTSDTDAFVSPRLTPDGTLYVERDTPDAGDTGSYTMAVYYVDPTDPSADEETWVGDEVQETLINGWDVRQPQSKGTSDFVGDANHDLVARDSNGYLFAYRGTGFDLSGRTQIGSGWKGFNAILAAGDLTSDDQADLIGRDANGQLWLYRGKPAGGFAARTSVGTGWNAYSLVAPGDFNGDSRADIVARDGYGNLWLYPGTGRGTLAARVKLGTGWSGLTIVGPGDIDFDNRADLMTRDSSGRVWIYPGNGTGGFLARRQIGSGFGSFNAITATEITSYRPLIWVRTGQGELVSFELTGDGAFSPDDVYSEGYGWGGLTLTS